MGWEVQNDGEREREVRDTEEGGADAHAQADCNPSKSVPWCFCTVRIHIHTFYAVRIIIYTYLSIYL
jgi:hypothetical protein